MTTLKDLYANYKAENKDWHQLQLVYDNMRNAKTGLGDDVYFTACTALYESRNQASRKTDAALLKFIEHVVMSAEASMSDRNTVRTLMELIGESYHRFD